MDFGRVLKTLLAEFERRQIRYAIIGGFALGVLGVPRATVDLDFLVHRDDLETLHGMLTGLGYERIVRTENVSHYRHGDVLWGSLDFIHAFRKAALQMLERAKSNPVFGGTQTVKVAEAEDVIGLKVQAMANDPRRRIQELGDIERLMDFYGSRLDWERIQEYFALFEMGKEARELRERFGDA